MGDQPAINSEVIEKLLLTKHDDDEVVVPHTDTKQDTQS